MGYGPRPSGRHQVANLPGAVARSRMHVQQMSPSGESDLALVLYGPNDSLRRKDISSQLLDNSGRELFLCVRSIDRG